MALSLLVPAAGAQAPAAPFGLDPGHAAFDPQVGVDARGTALFGWQRGTFEGGARVLARTRSAAGRLGPIISVSGSAPTTVHLQMAVTAHRGAIFAWTRMGGSRSRVQFVTRSARGARSAIRTLSARGSKR